MITCMPQDLELHLPLKEVAAVFLNDDYYNECVDVLLNSEDINQASIDALLIKAAKSNYTDAIQTDTIQKALATGKSSEKAKNEALWHAAREGKAELLRVVLLEEDVNLHYEIKGVSVLRAAQEGGCLECIDLITTAIAELEPDPSQHSAIGTGGGGACHR
jgi:mannitol-specific phosphotransferase system IIBC component